MPSAVAGHSHRATTKANNKSFKSKKATKGALRDQAKGKVPNERRKTPQQQVMSKLDRRNQNKQRQQAKFQERQKENSVFNGRDGAPRNVAVIPLCADADAADAVRSLNASIDIEQDVSLGANRVPVDRFKQKLQYVALPRDLTACLDAARVADFVILVLSADVEVDDIGELILRSVESQGLTTLFTVVQGLDKIEPAKQRNSVLDSLRSYITHFHPDQHKIYSLGNRQECLNLMRSLCSTTPKGIKWRDDRSWMLVEDVRFGNSSEAATVVTGVIRGKGLKADRLVQVGDWGTFMIEKITDATLSNHGKKSEEGMNMDEASEFTLALPTEDQDDVPDLAPEEVMMDDADGDIELDDADGDIELDDATSVSAPAKKGVLLDEHHYFSDEDEHIPYTKRVPKGTSKYQAAWYLDDDVSESGSDMTDIDMRDNEESEDEARPEDGVEGLAGDAQTEAGASEYPRSEAPFMELDEDEDAAQLSQYRTKKKDEAQEDLEFPDEIELLPNVLARERLARYRGLKSLQTSPWELDEDKAFEPEEWRRLLQVQDYQASRIRSIREALVGGIPAGTRVHVYLKGVPSDVKETFDQARPLTLCSLLRHENKRTAVNFLFNLSADYSKSIKSKEELIIQYGPRRFVINPQFSLGNNTPNDVHKFCRFLHPGQSAVATFMGPVAWGAVPALFFKRSAAGEAKGEEDSDLPLTLVGTGTALPPSTSRVIAKRVILTGHPYHINKKIVTIRYMFFNREDVEWFKALPLWTRRGRSGYIKEPLGTHGYFKATFDGRINPQDSIGVSLYKRVWPRNATPLKGLLLDPSEISMEQDEAMVEDN